jgi:hypothetical protein
MLPKSKRSSPREQEFVAVPRNNGYTIEWLMALLEETLEYVASRIWRHVLAADNGMAPCIDGGMLS